MGTPQHMPVEELLELERAGWDSLCTATASDFYGDIMLPDALMVLANGMVLDRAAVVSALSQSPPWRMYEISEPRLISLGDDHAVLVYIGAGYRDGPEPAFVGAMSSVYQRTGGRWMLALYQQTKVG
jgi:hypothetical protein